MECVNLIDFDGETLLDEEESKEMLKSRVAQLKEGFNTLTADEKEQLAQEMGVGADKDFPTA
jgi:hypothetical protein